MNAATLTKPAPAVVSNHIGPEITVPTVAELDVTDRCDVGVFHGKDESCDAQAYVRVEFVTGELYFCGHHYTEKADGISRTALRIRDERAFAEPAKTPYTGNGLN